MINLLLATMMIWLALLVVKDIVVGIVDMPGPDKRDEGVREGDELQTAVEEILGPSRAFLVLYADPDRKGRIVSRLPDERIADLLEKAARELRAALAGGGTA